MKELLELVLASIQKYAYSGNVDPNQPVTWMQLTKALETEIDKMEREERFIPLPDPISEMLRDWKKSNHELNTDG